MITFALAVMLFVSIANAQERVSEKELIEAFLKCPEIIGTQKEFAKGTKLDTPKVVLYSSMCGYAGCQYTALVAQKYEWRQSNPTTMHILGRVHVGPQGDIVKVERVELIPFKELIETRGKR